MIGLVLWYKSDPGVGLVWCEDQGPLAFLGADVPLPEGAKPLHCGDQLRFRFETRGGVRHVCEVLDCTAATGDVAPHEIIASYHRSREADRKLRVVA